MIRISIIIGCTNMERSYNQWVVIALIDVVVVNDDTDDV